MKVVIRRLLPLPVLVMVWMMIASCGVGESLNEPAAEPDRPNYQVQGGWGPDRESFTVANPSPHVTFNSLTDNPAYGDERNFFRVKESDASSSEYTDDLHIEGMERLTAYIYFENSIDTGVDDGWTRNARLNLLFPSTITGSGRLTAVITADNATPTAVYDSVVLTLPTATTGVALRYVHDSATIYSGGRVNERRLDMSELGGDGALLGCDELDGRVSGEARCAGYVKFDFVVDQPRFTVDSSVGATEISPFGSSLTLKPGGTFVVRAEYKNTGSVRQDDVTVSVADLPRCVSIVPGSMQTATSKTDGRWVDVPDGDDVGRAHNMGSYSPRGGNFFLRMKLQVCDIDQLGNEYLHDFTRGALWLSPSLRIAVDTANGRKFGQSLLITISGPNQ